MPSVPDLRRLLAYDSWANHQYLEALSRLPSAPQAAVRTLGHIVGAQRLWLVRLTGSGGDAAVWPAFERSAWAQAFDELAREWSGFRSSLTEERLATSISYKNSKGEPWTSEVGDVLMHIVMHGAYHRGQLARELRLAGENPPYTDYIHAVRQGFVS